jgi:hypothetical protein
MVHFQISLPGLARDFNNLTNEEINFIMFLIPHPLAVGFPLVPSPWGEG